MPLGVTTLCEIHSSMLHDNTEVHNTLYFAESVLQHVLRHFVCLASKSQDSVCFTMCFGHPGAE